MKYIDLTHTLTESIPAWPGKTPFKRIVCANYEAGYKLEDMSLSQGIGTHIDAPMHFFPQGKGVDQIALSQLIAPLQVMDISNEIGDEADFLITAQHILNWEEAHGRIESASIFLINTGWARFWMTEKYCPQDDNGRCHFPGIDKAAAELLLARQIAGVGIDTMSIDQGCAEEFIAHLVLLPADIYIIENLVNLDLLPARGAIGYALPMKIADAPEAPLRMIAQFPD